MLPGVGGDDHFYFMSSLYSLSSILKTVFTVQFVSCQTGQTVTSAFFQQYDLSASTFSPDGRVFQVEYAMKAVENSR